MGSRKAVTMTEVARAAGVSIATVGRVLHNHGYAAGDKRERILRTAENLGYRLPVKETETAKTRLVGVLSMPEITNPFFPQIAYHLSEQANRRQLYSVSVVEELTNESVPELVKKLMEQNVCGIVITGFSQPYMTDHARDCLLACGVPVVMIERTAGCYGLNRVLVDGGEGTRLAAQYLMEQGHRYLAYIGPVPGDDVDTERLEGFRSAVEGLPIPEPLVILKKTASGEGGYEAIREALEKRPEITGVVAWSDIFAVRALQYCSEAGISVPGRLSVIGFDGIYAPYSIPPLTSVEMPLEEMAKAAITMIIENQDKTLDFYAKTVKLSPRLIVRKSTGAVPAQLKTTP